MVNSQQITLFFKGYIMLMVSEKFSVKFSKSLTFNLFISKWKTICPTK